MIYLYLNMLSNSKCQLKPLKLIFDCCKNVKCKCEEVSMIQRYLINYSDKIKKLNSFTYNKVSMSYKTINAFCPSSKNNNDINNKLRENIIGAIINNSTPENYFTVSNRWKHMKDSINSYIDSLVKIYDNEQQSDQKPFEKSPIEIKNVKLSHCGGRRFNYDFIITINETMRFNIELKYNSSTVDETPQFVSPMKPSQYMSSSYEEYFYDNYLPRLSELSGFSLPERKQYLKEIHTNTPLCMKDYQELYYKGCKQSSKYTGEPADIKFYEYSKEIDNESRRTFIENNDLNIELLSSYLQESQNGKIYMLYKDNNFKLERVNMDDYKLVNYEKKPKKYMYIATSLSGKKIKILLRWKNGNGIAYPAFQIS